MTTADWVFGALVGLVVGLLLTLLGIVAYAITLEQRHANRGHVKIHNVWVMAQDAPEFVKMVQRCEADLETKDVEK